jgi:chromosome segregation ATPase
VPDVYRQNLDLSSKVDALQKEVETYKGIASKARSTYDKLRKERDFHRMHHKRVMQEKQRLMADVKRLKQNYSKYDPMMAQLQSKYENAMKERMLTKIERDKLLKQV